MRSSEQIQNAVKEIARRIPHDRITFADVAEAAGVHWTTVRRHFGSKEAMRAFISQHCRNPAIADTRTKILCSANRVFAKHGYHGATLDLVAHDAGMTKGAVYWHFSSKSDLFLALCEQSLDQLLDRLPKQVDEVLASANPMEALSLLLASEFESCKKDNGERSLLFFEFVSNSRDPQVRAKLNKAFAGLITETSKILEDMQDRRLIAADASPRDLAVTLHALINGAVLMWLVAPQQVSFTRLAAEISRVLWQGVRSE
jgi:TetR/AcrR family acrAB operon transcriptional repressor